MSWKLVYTDCVSIQIFLQEGLSHRQIAGKLGKSNSSISDEIKKYSLEWVYRAQSAWLMRKTKRALINLFRSKIQKWSEIELYILEKIKLYRSPEQVAWRRWDIGKDTVYRYIKQYPELVKQYCRRRWKKYRYGTITAGYIYDRRSIHERPKIVYQKGRYGDWEWDTVGNWCVTYVERKSKYLLSALTDGKYAKSVTESTVKLFTSIPESLRKTVTLDNGREFVEHYMRKELCWVDTYFADRANPWQRWLNENTNWLLRQFFPKKTNFSKVTAKQLAKAVHLLNNRPRKLLNYRTPSEVLSPYCADLE